jgi:mRNA interferase MazF
MRRCDLVTVAMPGAYGKPGPVVFVQADAFADLESVTLHLISEILPNQVFRVLTPTPGRERSVGAIPCDGGQVSHAAAHKVGTIFGRSTEAERGQINRALAMFLGFV